MDQLTVALVAAVLILAFKDHIGPWLNKLYIKLKVKKSDNLLEWRHARVMNELDRYGAELMMHRGELNHIKGQLQEVLHRLQAPAPAAPAVELSGIQTELAEVKDMLHKATNGESQAEANSVYLQSLAGIARASEKQLEELDAIKGIMGQMVAVLNKLTTG